MMFFCCKFYVLLFVVLLWTQGCYQQKQDTDFTLHIPEQIFVLCTISPIQEWISFSPAIPQFSTTSAEFDMSCLITFHMTDKELIPTFAGWTSSTTSQNYAITRVADKVIHKLNVDRRNCNIVLIAKNEDENLIKVYYGITLSCIAEVSGIRSNYITKSFTILIVYTKNKQEGSIPTSLKIITQDSAHILEM